jgi:hypothetical protein
MVFVEVQQIPSCSIETHGLVDVAPGRCPKTMADEVTATFGEQFGEVGQLSEWTIHRDRVLGVAPELSGSIREDVEGAARGHPLLN